MAELLHAPGFTVEDSGEIDRIDRAIAVLRLSTGEPSEASCWRKWWKLTVTPW